MTEIGFEWDSRCDRENGRRHGMRFEDAWTVFLDDKALRFPDPDFPGDEARFIMLGMSASLRALIVCQCRIAGGDPVRIIGARKALKTEEPAYRSG